MRILFVGGRCTWNDVASRFLTGIWCISAFVIVQAYTSTLITYIITPTNFPLIDTAYDIAANPDIKILFEKDRAFDRLVSVSRHWYHIGLSKSIFFCS